MASITKRGTKWHVRYRGPDHRERSGTFDRKVDAEIWAADERSKMARGRWVDPRAGQELVGAYVERWFAGRQLAVTTRDFYRYLFDRYVLPEFGRYPLAALSTSDIAAWHAKIAVDQPSIAARSYSLLGTVTKAAIRDRLLTWDPCQVPGAGDIRSPERPVASAAEFRELVEAMPGHLRLGVRLGFLCSMRRGEVLGLRREDVDLGLGTVSISHTRVNAMYSGIVEKGPKSKSSRRTLAVPPDLLIDLASHLDRYVSPAPESSVLVGKQGKPIDPNAFDAAWRGARSHVGLPHLHFHDLRHSGLTLAAQAGATIAELMHRAGHATPRMAMRYQHATLERDQALAERLNELVNKERLDWPAT